MKLKSDELLHLGFDQGNCRAYAVNVIARYITSARGPVVQAFRLHSWNL
jgi:hypothetical protein